MKTKYVLSDIVKRYWAEGPAGTALRGSRHEMRELSCGHHVQVSSGGKTSRAERARCPQCTEVRRLKNTFTP